ncbi:MAG: glycosyltransferase family 2 protein [Candidatus Peribacteraceae bacterium]|nr:glycosyltransferase family 2 protein [Candidatus Peribacteraceae bacterium]MBP9850084.1 glycosyltransferase family 2 protein [Candidatus Peribacteraceae bacterium]
MTIDSPLLGIPTSIRRLQRFGVGNFTNAQIEKKCAFIHGIMEKRMNPERPLFSVAIPAHKETGYLLATLRSLAEQTNQNTEFIVVCNGEQRGSPTERMAKAAGFKVISLRKGGIARARQSGLMAARGTIVVTTDADTVHLPTWMDAIAADWKTETETPRVAGFGPVHALSPSLVYQVSSSVQNMMRSMQGRHFFFSAAEANSWYLRSAALSLGGYETESNYFEGSILLKKLADLGDLRCATDKRAGVYASDRRTISERMKAGTQYMFGISSDRMRYAVVR